MCRGIAAECSIYPTWKVGKRIDPQRTAQKSCCSPLSLSKVSREIVVDYVVAPRLAATENEDFGAA